MADGSPVCLRRLGSPGKVALQALDPERRLRATRFLCGLTVAAAALALPMEGHAQSPPLGVVTARGQTVTPVYEGWYENEDGSYTLSFGYFNRNFEEIVDIPLGVENRIEPVEFDGTQPTTFHARRHWGVFGVRVPADFEGELVWTLTNRGKTFSIPGHLRTDWKIDAIAGEATFGNQPPMLAFIEDGPKGSGPGGIVGPALIATVGEPVELRVWTADDGKQSGNVATDGRRNVPVTLTWLKFSGPGDVTFSEESAPVEVTGGWMTTTATFDAPGDYTIRVRANDVSGVSGAGHSQCCWSNGYVKVTVTH